MTVAARNGTARSPGSTDARRVSDRYNLSRFVEAQDHDYAQALSEIASGRKRTHWMWYIFPQLAGLGSSPTARQFAITGLPEARAYLDHPVLGPRLRECAEAAVALEGGSAMDVFGYPDNLKLRSCATLFAAVQPPGSVFDRLIAKYFAGERDATTLRLLHVAPEAGSD